ncbi:DUF2141 domain-containing protein [uncultured Massilia sp.]|uniref:DUF2141 domain-containing protein n=1 Tax=uncultured Massilia sp. TaxID=169973 RepID=UPI0025E80AE8|nr:DUF2141 domain-containing protein [uncultured Massilia sp.]
MHKTILAVLLALAGACHAAHAGDLVIHVDNVKSAGGQVKVALFDGAGNFLKKTARVAEAPAAAGAVTVTFKDVAAGDYGFSVYHDANDNGKLDRNMMGIPVEPFAFSNDAQGHMGPPAFDAAKIAVPAAGLDTTVTLR